MCINIIGNLFVMYTLIFSRDQLSSSLSKSFIFNLAITDLLVGVIVLPCATISSVIGYWPFLENVCTLCSIIEESACIASIVFLGFLSVDRYIAVSQPYRYHSIMSTGITTLLIIFGWLITFSASILPGFLIWPLDVSRIILCSWGEYAPYHSMATVQSPVFFTSMFAIGFCNWRIYKIVQLHRVSIAELNFVQRNLFVIDTHIGLNRVAEWDFGVGIKSRKDSEVEPNCLAAFFPGDNKAIKTIGRIVGGFMICWGPFFTVYTFVAFGYDFSGRDEILKIFIWFGYLNSCINPIIIVSTVECFSIQLRKLGKGFQCFRNYWNTLMNYFNSAFLLQILVPICQLNYIRWNCLLQIKLFLLAWYSADERPTAQRVSAPFNFSNRTQNLDHKRFSACQNALSIWICGFQ